MDNHKNKFNIDQHIFTINWQSATARLLSCSHTLESRPICISTVPHDNQHIWGGDFFNRYLWHLTLSCHKIILGSWSIYFTVLKETKKEKKMEKREREREIFDEIVEQTSAMSEVRVHLDFYSVSLAAYVSSSMRRALSIEGLL